MVCFIGRRVFKCFDFRHERHCALKKVFFNIISNFFLKVNFTGDEHLFGSEPAYGLQIRPASFVRCGGLHARRRPAPLALHLSAYARPYEASRRWCWWEENDKRLQNGYISGTKKWQKNFPIFAWLFSWIVVYWNFGPTACARAQAARRVIGQVFTHPGALIH
jgi:hypothetical protein